MTKAPSPAWGTPRTDRATFGRHLALVAKELGFPLYDWQREVSDVCLEHVDGRLQYRTVIVSLGRQNGKTALCAARVALELLKPGANVAYCSQDRSIGRLLWEEHVNAILASSLSKRVRRVTYANGREQLELTNGSVYRVITPSKKGSRGLTLDLAIIDEAAQFSDMELLAALQPTLATKENGQLFIVSNAGDSSSVLLKHFRTLGHEQDKSTETRLAYFEYAPKEPKFDIHDSRVWFEAIPSLHEKNGVTLAAVEEAAASLDPAIFSREWLNVWAAEESVSLFGDEWDALEKPDQVIPNHGLILGLDVNPDRTAATIAGAGKSGQYYPIEIIDHRGGVGWIQERVEALSTKYRAPIVIDGGSPAGSFIPQLEQAGIEVVTLTAKTYAHACANFFDGVQNKQITHLGDRMLTNSVKAATKRKLGDGWAFQRRSAVDITPLVASALAYYGLTAGATPRPIPAIF